MLPEKYKNILTKEFLLYHFIELDKTITQISRENNIPSTTTVSRKLQKYGIKKDEKPDPISKELLEDLYINKEMSVMSISKQLGIIGHQALFKKMKRYGIRIRKPREKACYNTRRNGFEELGGVYWSKVKRGAIKRNLIFDVSPKDAWDLFILQDRKCKLSGVQKVIQ